MAMDPMSSINFMMSLFMLLLSNGGGTDLLDAFPTDGYWQAKQVTVTVDQLLADAEHPPVAAEGHPKEAQIRQLMAIRTLGQQKQARAIPLLKNLTNSKDPFVAEYAAAALKAIDGQLFQRPISQTRSLKSDLSLIPAKVDVVAQWVAGRGNAITISEIITGFPGAAGQDNFKTLDKEILEIAERVGNARIDSISLGARGVGEDSGFVVVVLHGTYDSQALAQFLKDKMQMTPRQGANLQGVDVLVHPQAPVAVFLAGDQRVIVIAGPEKKSLPIDDVAAALQNGGGGLSAIADEMAKNAPGDGDRIIWAVAKVTAAMRRDSPELKAFKSGALTIDRKDDVYRFELKGAGDDAAQVADGAALWTRNLEEGKTSLKNELTKHPFLKPMADVMDSIKFQADGVKASMTGVFTGKPWSLVQIFQGMVMEPPMPSVELQPLPPPATEPAPQP